MSARRASAGFTLIELVVVLAILAVVASLVVVALDNGRDAAELRAAASEIRALLRGAHGAAVAENREIRFAVEGRLYLLDGQAHAFTTSGLARGAVRAETTGVAFFPTGGSSGGRVVLAEGQRQRAIEVDAATARLADAR
jgi:general secretion pathway protein H